MASAWDVAFGRLAIQHGLVPQEAVRAAFQQLPPGRSLADELVRRGLLAPERAAQLAAWLRASATPSGRLPRQDGDDAVTLAAPPAAAPSDEGATLSAPPGPAGVTATEVDVARGQRSSRAPRVGDVVGGYALEGLLGAGGMGAVFRARDPRTGGEVAVKVLLAGGDVDGMALARFQREAEAVAKVDAHAGIVRVRGVGSHQGLPFAVMDLVQGRDLHEIVKTDGALDPERALRYTEQVARAVQHCHARGVLHRDLKPANVLLRDGDDTPLVMDFGLALDRDAERLTRTGELMGTPAYMSPEQADGDKAAIDARTDVYALGAILFELVTGRPPFQGQPFEVLRKVFTEMPPPIASLAPRTPADVDVIVRKAMAKDRALRYETAGALADDVARLRRGEPIEARAPTRWQELRWRWRRRDPRLLRAIVAVVLALVAPPSAVALYTAAADRQRAKALVEVLPQLAGAVDSNPWPLTAAGRREVDERARAALSLAATLERRDDDALSTEALLALRAWLDASEGWGAWTAAALPDRPAVDRALARLSRRLALTHDGAGATCAAAHAPWWGAPLPDVPGDPGPEEQLVAVLRDLRWGCQASGDLTLEQAHAARRALESLARAPGAPGVAAGELLAAMEQLESQVRGTLGAGRRDLLAQLSDKLTRLETDGTLARPGAWATPLHGGPLEAWLVPLRFQVELSEAAAVLDATVDAIPAEVDWKDPRMYRALAGLLSAVAELPAPRDDAERAEVERALDRQAARLVFEVGWRANEAGVAALEFAELVAVAAPMLRSVDPVEGEGGERRTYHAAASCLAFSCFQELGRGATPTPQLVAAAARFGFEPRLEGRQRDLERIMAMADEAAERYPVGELFLLRARLRNMHRPRGRGDTAGRNFRRSAENVTLMVDDLATALGSHLPAAERATLGLAPPRPGLRPILRNWAPRATGDLAHLRLRLEAIRPEPPSRAVVEACDRLVEQVLSGPEPLPARERANLCKEAGEAFHELSVRLEGEARTLDWAAALRARARALWERTVEAALVSAERATDGGSVDASAPELQGQFSALVALDLDTERPLEVLVLRGLLGLSHTASDMAWVIGQVEATERRIHEIGLEPPLGLYELWVQLEARRGDAARAAQLARAQVERVDRQLPGLADPDAREDAQRARSRARAFLAGQLLDGGDAAAARALLEAARAAGDLDLPDTHAPWARLQQLDGD